jgi:hypothetical protein
MLRVKGSVAEPDHFYVASGKNVDPDPSLALAVYGQLKKMLKNTV